MTSTGLTALGTLGNEGELFIGSKISCVREHDMLCVLDKIVMAELDGI